MKRFLLSLGNKEALMRKICLVTLLACLALLPLTGSAQAYLTVIKMLEQPPVRWTQVYETKWRTVGIDVQPMLPQADKIPILKVIPDFWLPDVSALGTGWKSELSKMGSCTFRAYLDDIDQEESNAHGETTTTNYYPPFNMDASYAPGNDLTLNDVLNHLKCVLGAMGEGQAQWQYDQPNRIFVNTTVSNKTGKLLLPGSYAVFLNQQLQGVPVLCHVLEGVDDVKDQEIQLRIGLTFQIRKPEAASLGGKQVKVTDVLADDVPLCDFGKVKAAIEKEIQAGHIRKIFDLELGYALYNEPGVSRKPGAEWFKTAVFYTVPVWRVNCHYVESGKKELRNYEGTGVTERGMIEYKTLIVNAQTGMVLDRNENRKGCGDYAGFISWEEAGSKP
jgi:hypothetical protein